MSPFSRVYPIDVLKVVDEPLSESCFPRKRGGRLWRGAFVQNSEYMGDTNEKTVCTFALLRDVNKSLVRLRRRKGPGP